MESKLPLLISVLFDSRTKAHFAHLMTRSYAAHIALNDYYDGIIPLADSLAENHIGRYGLIEEFPKISVPTEPVEMLKMVRQWIDQNRMDCCPDSEAKNIIDSVLNLVNSTLYKLENLS